MKQTTWWTIGGIIALIGGFFALFNPFAASLAATFIAGWAFLLMGILQIVAIFGASGTGNKILLGLIGAMSAFVGISLLGNPLEGMLTLTLVIGIIFLVSGIFRLFAAFSLRGTNAFWLLLLSALATGVLGVLILADYPTTAASILGILLGIDLIFNGVALLSLASAGRKLVELSSR